MSSRATGSPSTDGLRRGERERTREDREPGQQRLLRFGKQVVRPVERGAQGPVALDARPSAPGQQAEHVVEAIGDLGRTQRAGPGRRQLDRQRNAVEAAADPGDGLGVSGGVEDGARLLGPQDEQLHGGTVVVHAQRRSPTRSLALDVERLPRGGQHLDRRTRRHDSAGDLRGGVQQVLAVVEDQEGIAKSEAGDQGVQVLFLARLDAEQAEQRSAHRVRPVDGVERGEPDAVTPSGLESPAHLQRQPGLADPARAGDA